MNKSTYTILAALTVLAGCVEISDRSYEQKRLVEQYAPHCRQETTVAVYDDQGTFEVPGCADWYYPEEAYPAVTAEPVTETMRIKRTVKHTKTTTPQFEQGIDVDEIDGSFPEVEQNKYVNEVVLENRNTHVLAYCRGTEEEVEICVSRLENSCYVRIEDIPRFAAKYDTLKTSTYPTRRWRNGELFPRW